MKFPSIFKTASYQRFAIKPRYYDPIKEEIRERTARIKRELDEDERNEQSLELTRTAIKGSFSSYRVKNRDNSVFNSTAMIRTLLFLGMVIAAFGYIYIGPEIFTYLAYIAGGVAVIYYLLKFFKRSKNA